MQSPSKRSSAGSTPAVPARANNSAVEFLVYTEAVGGSNPSSPISFTPKEMKKIESREQLLQRFAKRIIELRSKLEELQSSYDEYIKIERDLVRLEGSIQVVKYISLRELPKDGNHDGMKDHDPNK